MQSIYHPPFTYNVYASTHVHIYCQYLDEIMHAVGYISLLAWYESRSRHALCLVFIFGMKDQKEEMERAKD